VIETIAWNTRPLEGMIGRDLLLLVLLGVGYPIIGVRVGMDAVVANRVIGLGMGHQRLVDEWSTTRKRTSLAKKKNMFVTDQLTNFLFSCCYFFLADILSIYLK
jgi:hypothetical protein